MVEPRPKDTSAAQWHSDPKSNDYQVHLVFEYYKIVNSRPKKKKVNYNIFKSLQKIKLYFLNIIKT